MIAGKTNEVNHLAFGADSRQENEGRKMNRFFCLFPILTHAMTQIRGNLCAVQFNSDAVMLAVGWLRRGAVIVGCVLGFMESPAAAPRAKRPSPRTAASR